MVLVYKGKINFPISFDKYKDTIEDSVKDIVFKGDR